MYNSPDEWWCSAFCDIEPFIIGACAEAAELEPVNPNICEPECRNGSSCRRGTCVNQVGIVVNPCADGFVRIGADLNCVEEPEGFCQNATDCGPGHFCENNVCTDIELDVPTPTCLGYQTCQNGYICQANGVALCR